MRGDRPGGAGVGFGVEAGVVASGSRVTGAGGVGGGTAGSTGNDERSTGGSVSAAGAAGVAASSGVGASISIELPTMATLFGNAGGAGAGRSAPASGSSKNAACSPTESSSAAEFGGLGSFTAAFTWSLTPHRGAGSRV